ncbi:MAG: glycosyltransferase family 2 protein [bacterium]|nr:glycosyltransferase family 2 protein [bacterium]
MKLSIIVIFYNMRREAQRTLYSLSRAYQRNVDGLDYEVIAIDNASAQPLDDDMVKTFGPNFRYHCCDTTSVSPVTAVNHGVALAQGDVVAVIVDGARMASPGLIAQSVAALALAPETFACGLAWHIGPDIQPRSIQHGYDQDVEDRLLDVVDWRRDGYQLFSISTIAPSSRNGFLGDLPPEVSWFCMSKVKFEALGGFNPAFRTPGGGLCNHEFRNRAATDPEITSIVILGEGVFHQAHGGAATGAMPNARPDRMFSEEYTRIVGKPFRADPPVKTLYAGEVTAMARPFLQL